MQRRNTRKKKIKTKKKFCSDYCKGIHKNKMINEKWINKENKKQIPRAITHAAFHICHVSQRKEEAYLRKFNRVRG